MQLVTHPPLMPAACRQAVVALGNFDGLHKGHQVVLGRAFAMARAQDLPFGVMTFEPHPRTLLRPQDAPFRITPAAVKRRLLDGMGVDVLFEIPFTRDFSQLPAEAFVNDLLLRDCGIRHAVAGHDFVFGHGRGGDIALLRRLLAAQEVGVDEVAPQMDSGGQLWSSTRVRDCLAAGDMKGAADILGRNWEVEGVVLPGDRRGQALGFPTANMEMGESIRPRYGVYAVRVQQGAAWHKGVANLGVRPTVDGRAEKLEVHLFDFSGDLYGQRLRVEFVDFIRAESAFPSLEALKNQIANDCLVARKSLN